MAGIYVHVPFCKKACNYCNFHFSTSMGQLDAMVEAILTEAMLRKNYLEGDLVNTIYFGGGTPSLLPVEDIKKILAQLYSTQQILPDTEITLEANPDDITNEKLGDWIAAGINRLSIGVQSFFDDDLVWMNRAHKATQAANCIAMARQNGFSNLTIDLIYGTPTLTDEQWKHNVTTAVALGVPHLSCYALTVEPNTALHYSIKNNNAANVDVEKQARHFELLVQWLEALGYEQYEISNFALPGWQSRHNSSYWKGKKYLGLGPSAHSFNVDTRQWNVANNIQYINGLSKGHVPFEVETLTESQQLNEYIMISLRTSKGIDLPFIKTRFGSVVHDALLHTARYKMLAHNVLITNNVIVLTPSGRLLADGIAADLFQV